MNTKRPCHPEARLLRRRTHATGHQKRSIEELSRCSRPFDWPLATDHWPLRKLLQKPHVPIEEQLQIIHPILQQSDPVRAHAEGKPGDFSRVIPVVLHKLKHVGIHHAASENFDPPSLL